MESKQSGQKLSSPPTAQLKALSAALFDPALSGEVNLEIDKQAAQPTVASLATASLSDRFYSQLQTGRLSGHFSVRWNGMDEFVYLPDPNEPLTYTTLKNRVIRPRLMYTDGGSIPRVLRGFKKFSSWGYAPAFMVHDWLFTAKKCGHEPDHDWAFEASAQIMAEVMKCLMQDGFVDYADQTQRLAKAEDTLYVMYLAVRSAIARKQWNDSTGIRCLA